MRHKRPAALPPLLAGLLTLATASAAPAPIVLKPGATTASLTWTKPSTNIDGTRLQDLAAFNIYGGPSTSALKKIQSVSASATSYVASGLKPGTYYFAVRSVNKAGKEGPPIVIGPVIVRAAASNASSDHRAEVRGNGPP